MIPNNTFTLPQVTTANFADLSPDQHLLLSPNILLSETDVFSNQFYPIEPKSLGNFHPDPALTPPNTAVSSRGNMQITDLVQAEL